MSRYWKVALPIALGVVVLLALVAGMAMASNTEGVKSAAVYPAVPGTFTITGVVLDCTGAGVTGTATLEDAGLEDDVGAPDFDFEFADVPVGDYEICFDPDDPLLDEVCKQTGDYFDPTDPPDEIEINFVGKNCIPPYTPPPEYPPKLGCEIQVPEIDVEDDWTTVIHVFNKGIDLDGTGAVAFFWGPYSGECPSTDEGPMGHACMNIPKNGVWTLKRQIPDGARSAIIYSVDKDIFQQSCEDAGDAVGSTEAWKDWKLKCRCTGQPIAVVVDRWGPNEYNCNVASAYEGIAPSMGEDEDFAPPFDYFLPYIMRGYLDRYTTIISIQNSGQECTSVWLYFRKQVAGFCQVDYAWHVEVLAPGETIKLIPPEKLGCDYLGSAYVTANEELGIVVDQVSLPSTYEDDLEQAACDDTDQCMMRTYRGWPYEHAYRPFSFEVFADLIFQEFSGWDASIQVTNLTKQSMPTFVTVDIMDQSGDEIEFYGDWVCANGSRTFFLPAMVDLGKDLVGGAEIQSHDQVDYPGQKHGGEPIAAVVDLKKRKEYNPATELWDELEPGTFQGCSYNAHTKWQKWWWPTCTIEIALPYRQEQKHLFVGADIALPKVEKHGQSMWTSMIVLRNNSDCVKILPKIYFKDETGQVVCEVPVPWLEPKHMKVVDLERIGCLIPGWVGAAEVVVEETKGWCNFCPAHCYGVGGFVAEDTNLGSLGNTRRFYCEDDNGAEFLEWPRMSDDELQECGIMLSVVVVNRGTGTGDMTECYIGIPKIPEECLLEAQPYKKWD